MDHEIKNANAYFTEQQTSFSQCTSSQCITIISSALAAVCEDRQTTYTEIKELYQTGLSEKQMAAQIVWEQHEISVPAKKLWQKHF